jgi:hypothetical protein
VALLRKADAIRAVLSGMIRTVLTEDMDTVVDHNNDLFISSVGEILTQNE